MHLLTIICGFIFAYFILLGCTIDGLSHFAYPLLSPGSEGLVSMREFLIFRAQVLGARITRVTRHLAYFGALLDKTLCITQLPKALRSNLIISLYGYNLIHLVLLVTHMPIYGKKWFNSISVTHRWVSFLLTDI